jgi:hypothetical protein
MRYWRHFPQPLDDSETVLPRQRNSLQRLAYGATVNAAQIQAKRALIELWEWWAYAWRKGHEISGCPYCESLDAFCGSIGESEL